MSYEMMLKGAGTAQNLLGSYLSTQSSKYAMRASQNEIDIAMQQNTLQSTQQAIENQQRLNYTLSMQRAIAGARGQQIGQGSQLAWGEDSLRAHGQEEENRKSTLASAAYQAKAKKAAIGIDYKNKKQANFTKFLSSEFQGTSLNSLFGEYLNPTQGGKL